MAKRTYEARSKWPEKEDDEEEEEKGEEEEEDDIGDVWSINTNSSLSSTACSDYTRTRPQERFQDV